MRYGFKLIPKSDTFCLNDSELENYLSATCPDFKPDMDHLFLKELKLLCISKIDSKPHCVHSIGRVAKKDSPKFRPITDCSRLYGSSLNNHIKDDLVTFHLNSIDKEVLFSSPDCFYSIVDFESAWRWVPVFPPHKELQGFHWMFGTQDSSRYNYYVDNGLLAVV